MPPRSKERLLQLRQRAADTRATIEAAMDSRDQSWREAADLERSLKHLTRKMHRLGRISPKVLIFRAIKIAI